MCHSTPGRGRTWSNINEDTHTRMVHRKYGQCPQPDCTCVHHPLPQFWKRLKSEDVSLQKWLAKPSWLTSTQTRAFSAYEIRWHWKSCGNPSSTSCSKRRILQTQFTAQMVGVGIGNAIFVGDRHQQCPRSSRTGTGPQPPLLNRIFCPVADVALFHILIREFGKKNLSINFTACVAHRRIYRAYSCQIQSGGDVNHRKFISKSSQSITLLFEELSKYRTLLTQDLLDSYSNTILFQHVQ